MLKNTILELREKESLVKYENGHYSINLNQSLFLNPGDEIGINNVFLDTKNIQNKTITVENDIETTFSFVYYIANYDHAMFGEYCGFRPAASPLADPYIFPNDRLIDDKIFVACNLDEKGSDHHEITEIIVRGDEKFGDITLKWHYEDYHGNIQHYHLYVPEKQGPNPFRHSVRLYYKPSTFVLETTTAQLEKVNIYKIDRLVKELSTGIFFPHIETITFIIEKGEYLPEDLATHINLKLERNDYLPSTEVIRNPLLNYTKNTFCKHITNTQTDDVVPFFVRSDGEAAKMYDINQTARYKDVYIGANQFVFAYNNEQNLFEIRFNFTPHYDDVGNIITQNKEWSNDGIATNTHYAMTSLKHSGVILTAIDSVDTITGEKVAFFDGVMGFDYTKLLTNFQYKDFDVKKPTSIGGGPEIIGCKLPYFNPVVGENYSEMLNVIDNIVLKSKFPKIPQLTHLDRVGNVVQGDFPFNSTATNTYLIKADSIVNKVELETGYFMIEIDYGTDNKMIGQNTNRNNIRAIVNRYFNVGSGTNTYTSGGAETSINYIHYGEPVLIRSFTIKILNSNFEIPPDIGDDNTVFLNVINKKIINEPEEEKK